MAEPAPRLRLLDAFGLSAGDRELCLAPQLQRLVAFLAIREWPGRYVVADLLWPDRPEDGALAALRTAAWRVHRRAPGTVTGNRQVLALSRQVQVDTRPTVPASCTFVRSASACSSVSSWMSMSSR